MTILFEERRSDSPYIETVTHGYTPQSGITIRPSEEHWHMCIVRVNGHVMPVVTGPLMTSGTVTYGAGAEILWIKFRLGVFMPHLPPKAFVDREAALPEAACESFWLHGSTWQYPNYENAETFIERLAKQEALVADPVVTAVLQERSVHDLSPRTLRHRFQHATGLTQTHIFQAERAKKATTLLKKGTPILDVIDQLGYFDQPHLTRSIKRFIGNTPAQLLPSTCQQM